MSSIRKLISQVYRLRLNPVKNMLEAILGAIHFILSSILLFFAARAYLRTKLPAIFYLTLGFAILAIGHLLFEVYYYNNIEMERFDEIFDIFALTAFIIAVEKS